MFITNKNVLKPVNIFCYIEQFEVQYTLRLMVIPKWNTKLCLLKEILLGIIIFTLLLALYLFKVVLRRSLVVCMSFRPEDVF